LWPAPGTVPLAEPELRASWLQSSSTENSEPAEVTGDHSTLVFIDAKMNRQPPLMQAWKGIQPGRNGGLLRLYLAHNGPDAMQIRRLQHVFFVLHEPAAEVLLYVVPVVLNEGDHADA
jgi:hypothetical protein